MRRPTTDGIYKYSKNLPRTPHPNISDLIYHRQTGRSNLELLQRIPNLYIVLSVGRYYEGILKKL